MDRIEHVANISVGRACAFGALAIFCCMIGLAHNLPLAAEVGGSFALVMSLILVIKAAWAERTPYKRTETWLILTEEERPPSAVAQKMISTVLRSIFLTYARYAAVTAVLLLGASLVFRWLLA